MVEYATTEDVLSSAGEPPLKDQSYLQTASGELKTLGKNPLDKIDFVKAEAANNAKWQEQKPKGKREYLLKRLFLQYAKKYALKWNSVINYPKQIKQKPAWFDLALSLFKENEISSEDKKIINTAFNMLWEYRDRIEPERVMSEEESLRQYGIKSPYFQQEGSQDEIAYQPEGEIESQELLQQDTSYMTPQPDIGPVPQPSQPEPVSAFGVRKITPGTDKEYLEGYTSKFKSGVVDISPFSPKTPKPQGNFTAGLTPSAKRTGGSGSGAFNIGRDMFSSFRGGQSLKSIMTPTRPSLPSQPVQVTPKETITVATQPSQLQQRNKKKSIPVAKRTIGKISNDLSKYRSIELFKISDRKIDTGLSMKVKKKSKKITISDKFDKKIIDSVSTDIRKSVGGIVGGVKGLKKQVRGEFHGGTLKDLNLKNIKSNKVKTNSNLNVLNKLKAETKSQMSRDTLECKMIPKLRQQCDKVFRKNQLTGEVSKFRSEFRDIAKTVPVVKGDHARIDEVGMLGRSINFGVDNAQVDDVRTMFKKSGSTKQMNIGKMEYDYSFVTGKKKPKVPEIEEYYEEE